LLASSVLLLSLGALLKLTAALLLLQGNVSNAELAARSHPAAVAPGQYTQGGAANANPSNLQPLGPAAAPAAQPQQPEQQPAAAASSSLIKVVRTAPVAAAAPVQSAGPQPIKSLPLSQMAAAPGASGTSPPVKVPPKKAAAAAAKSFEQSEDEKFRQMMEEAEVKPHRFGSSRATPSGSGQEAKRPFVPQEERQMEATTKANPGNKDECRFGRSVSHATSSSAVHGAARGGSAYSRRR